MKTMRIPAGLLGVLAAAAAAVSLQASARPREALPGAALPGAPPQTQAAPDPSRAFLDRNCIVCHNSRRLTANLALDAAAVDPLDAPRHAEVWEKVIHKLRTGAMPPAGRPRPIPRQPRRWWRTSRRPSTRPRRGGRWSAARWRTA